MDPISAISFVSAIVAIANLIAKGVSSLSELQSRFKIADLKVSLLIGQLSTLKAALTQIICLVENVPLGTQLVDDLATSLSSLETIISALDNQLDHLQLNAKKRMSRWAKVNFVWDEQTTGMHDYLSLLDHQVNALQLLLSALQCRTIFEQSDMLSTRECRHILQLARDETSSMRWLTETDSTSIAGTLQSIGTPDLRAVQARFDFDSEVLTSRAYMVASRATMIENLMASRRDRITYNTTGGSRGDDSTNHNGSSQTPGIDIALTTVVDTISDSDYSSDSECLSDLRPVTSTDPRASRIPLVRGSDSDAQLPEFVIHTPETLWLLAIQSGSSPFPRSNALPSRLVRALPMAEKKSHEGLFNQPRWLRLRSQPEKQVASSLTNDTVPFYEPVKILLLGISESGKSTLAKTMRAARGDIDVHWLREFRLTVFINTIMSLKWLLVKSRQTHSGTQTLQREGPWDADARAFSAIARIIEELKVDVFLDASSLATLASAAQYLWNHPYIREVFKTSVAAKLRGYHALYLPDCAEHFLNSVERIFKEGYLPSLEDVLWAQTWTTGTSESKFVINGRIYQLFDVGGARSEREKWLQVFQKSVNMVIFTIDCSCYVQVTNEDNNVNRMDEQLTLWETVAKSHCLKGAKIVILLTKEDKLTLETLRRHPFGAKFTDYDGDPDSAGDIIKYITWRLNSVLDQKRNIGSGHVTVCRSGSISESLKLWEKLLSTQGHPC